MLKPRFTSQFKKERKNQQKRGYDLKLLDGALYLLINEIELSSDYRDHELIGNYKDCRELHLSSDWLLIYKIDYQLKEITFIRTGTHTDLFDKVRR